MYQFATTLLEERRREASRYRLADSLPRRHTWSLGRYRITVAKAAEPSLHSST